VAVVVAVVAGAAMIVTVAGAWSSRCPVVATTPKMQGEELDRKARPHQPRFQDREGRQALRFCRARRGGRWQGPCQALAMARRAKCPRRSTRRRLRPSVQMVRVPLKEGRTLHHDGNGRFGAGQCLASVRRPQGTGIIAGGPMRAVFESPGRCRRGDQVGRHLEPLQHDPRDFRGAGQGTDQPQIGGSSVAARRSPTCWVAAAARRCRGRRRRSGSYGVIRIMANHQDQADRLSPIRRTKPTSARRCIGLGLDKMQQV
jgi:hypothetical protein